ncbi:MAG: NAD(P)H-hydrate epimerase [Planctomycetes bacterium]|nr:NAD(P)H-hydrate epimerase [Planctomycetota bacterium]
MAVAKTLTREQVRELDRRAIEEFGIPSMLLMENAARACTDEAERILRIDGVGKAMARLRQPGSKDDIPRTMEELERWKDKLHKADTPPVILCGPGNNGGDGLAIARTLHNRGHAVCVYYVGDPASLATAGPDVALNAKLLGGLGVQIQELRSREQLKAAWKTLNEAPLIIDALFGTGLDRVIEDPFRAVIEAANDADTPKLAVDIPSGLDANTGDILGVAIRAECTVTFVAEKAGFKEAAGPAFCGQVTVAEIGIPREYIEQAYAAAQG